MKLETTPDKNIMLSNFLGHHKRIVVVSDPSSFVEEALDKIESLGASIVQQSETGNYATTIARNGEIVAQAKDKRSRLQSTYEAVCEFILWYNDFVVMEELQTALTEDTRITLCWTYEYRKELPGAIEGIYKMDADAVVTIEPKEDEGWIEVRIQTTVKKALLGFLYSDNELADRDIDGISHPLHCVTERIAQIHQELISKNKLSES